MYSVVLLAAMTASAETPGFGDTWSKHCFWECCLPARYGWTCGPGWGGYYPASINSCHGGGHGNWSSCHGSCQGGWSSCHGSCHGNWSSCHGGCSGHAYQSSCHGCYSHTCYGCNSGSGFDQGIGYSGFGGYGNFGMYGTAPVYNNSGFNNSSMGMPTGTQGIDSQPAESKPLDAQPLDIKPTEIKPFGNTNNASPNTTAKIVLKVPADAMVYIDDHLMKSTATERIFTSPALNPDESYFYMVRVVVTREGREVEEVRKVSIRAGDRSKLAFEKLGKSEVDERAIVENVKK